jgi:hypothetical protein
MKRPCIACLILVGALVASSSVHAGLIADFRFNEAQGTVITDAANSAILTNPFLSTNTNVQSAMTGTGSFRIQKASPATQIGNTFDIPNVTTGKAWLVVDIAGWHYTATGSSTLERVRFGFLDNTDPVAANSSTITAEMTIDRLADNSLVLSGEALGTGVGATNIANDLTLTLSRSTPLRIVLELDKDLDQYSVYWKDGANPFQLLGTAELGPSSLNPGDRDGNSVRFAFTGLFNDTDEFFDVDRIFVTNMNPIPEPGTTLLVTLAISILVAFRRTIK